MACLPVREMVLGPLPVRCGPSRPLCCDELAKDEAAAADADFAQSLVQSPPKLRRKREFEPHTFLVADGTCIRPTDVVIAHEQEEFHGEVCLGVDYLKAKMCYKSLQ